LNEDTLKIIQNKFRNKKYYKNYNKYRKICYPNGKLDKKIIIRCVKTYNQLKYLAIAFENKKRQIEFNFWDMDTYE